MTAPCYIVQHQTVNAIAAEVGLTHHTVANSLRRHGLDRVAHTARRHAASQRAEQVAAGLGFDTMAGYIAARRAGGWTWRAMAEECGQPGVLVAAAGAGSSPGGRPERSCITPGGWPAASPG